MSGDDWDGQYNYDVLENALERAERLWNVVYDRLEHAVADIDAGRPTIEGLEAGKKPDVDEVGILRECTYEIVQAAIIALRGM